MRKKGFTLIELLVVIAIIAMLMAILMPALSKVKKIAQRVVCGTNLKGLGTAQTVYASDYDDEYAVQGRGFQIPWAQTWGGWQNPNVDWSGVTGVTIGASLYLLVREADVSPKSFVCPSSDQQEYTGENTYSSNPDIVQLWDFGQFGNADIMDGQSGPTNCVSYSYHMPYANGGGKSRYAADGSRSAAFAVMADKNPYMDRNTQRYELPTEQTLPDVVYKVESYWVTGSAFSESSPEVKGGNSHLHDNDGQNVAFADGHADYLNTADIGIKNDNIYTPWVDTTGSEISIRKGNNNDMSTMTLGNMAIQPLGLNDTLLLNDDQANW